MSTGNARRALALLLVAASALTACSGGATPLAPSGGSQATRTAGPSAPTTSPKASPKATASATATATAAATSGPGALMLPTAKESGTVVLPAGVNLSLGSLTALNSLGSVPVGSNGAFAMTAYSDGPQFTEILDPAGNAVLLGFFGPQSSTIDVNSTAVVTMYFSLACFSLTSDLRNQCLTLLPSVPGMSTLATAIGAALVGNPDAFANENDPVETQVQTLLATLIQSTSPSSNSVVSQFRAMFEGEREGMAFAMRRREGVLINPATPASGLTPIIDYPSGFHFQNTLRRPADLYVDRISYVDQSGTTQPDPLSLTPTTPLSIPATQGATSLQSTLINIINGKYAYSQISTSPTLLPLVTNSLSTLYQLTTVGPGYKAGAILQTTAEESQDQVDVSVEFLITNFALPLLLNFASPGDDIDKVLGTIGASSVLKDVVKFAELVPNVVSDIKAGNYSGALSLILFQLDNTSSLLYISMQSFLDGILYSYGIDAQQKAYAQAKKNLALLKLINRIITAFDASSVAVGFAMSDQADIWTVTVTPDKVTLTPMTSRVAEGFTETLRAAVPDASGSSTNLAYTWSNTAMFGHISDGNPAHGFDNFTTTSAYVTYVAGIDALGTDTVGVSVSSVDPQNRNLIGSQIATVQVIPSPVPTPSPIQITLSPSGCHDFGTSGGSQLYSASINATPAPGVTDKYLFSFGTDGGVAPSGTTFNDPGAVVNGQGFLGTSDSGTLTVASITGGGEANVSLTVELEEFNAQGQGVGPPESTSAVSFFSYGTLSCENSEQGRTRGI